MLPYYKTDMEKILLVICFVRLPIAATSTVSPLVIFCYAMWPTKTTSEDITYARSAVDNRYQVYFFKWFLFLIIQIHLFLWDTEVIKTLQVRTLNHRFPPWNVQSFHNSIEFVYRWRSTQSAWGQPGGLWPRRASERRPMRNSGT